MKLFICSENQLVKSFCLILFCWVFLFGGPNFTYSHLNDIYDDVKICDMDLQNLHIEDVERMLKELKTSFPNDFQYEEIGRSVKDRPIFLVKLGNGTENVLLWSQMHGDEPTATAALFDIFNYLMKNKDSEFCKDILHNITILAVPMLNPDGANKYRRRNAQGIDINRDARDLVTPEGRLLFSLKEKYQPTFGFNLHDQSGRRTVGNSNQLVAIALMAPPYDFGESDNPVRLRAKKVTSVIYEALGPYIYGHISKYDADYMPRAFGDSMQNWGVSTILIESGGWFVDQDPFLQRMNFIAITTALKSIGDRSYDLANPALYDIIPENDKNLYDLLVRNVSIMNGKGHPAFTTDLTIDYYEMDIHNPDTKTIGYFSDLGDMDYFAGKDTIEGDGLYLSPGYVCVINEFDENKTYIEINERLRKGFTTQFLIVREDELAELTELKARLRENEFAGKLVSLLLLDKSKLTTADSLRILKALRNGVNGLCAYDFTAAGLELANWVYKPSGILEKSSGITKIKVEETAEFLSKWRVNNRGTIRRNQIADFLLLSKKLAGYKVEKIYVNGHELTVEKQK